MRILSRKMLAAGGCVAALLAIGAATPASADVKWFVTGVFDDGGTLSGYIDINVYGYLSGYDLVAKAGSVVTTDFEYTPLNSYKNNSVTAPFYIAAWDKDPAYKGGLRLEFLKPLITGAYQNPLVVGAGGPSWECRDSWTCPAGGVPVTRYLVSGRASTSLAGVPEPATWGLMILGFGAVGGALRTRRRALAAA